MTKSLGKSASAMSAPCALDAAAKAELPPRVVVQMPDGDLTLGENTGKLAVCEAFQKAKLAEMTTAEGGTHTVGPQRHARMVAAQYALSLQRLLSRRARLFAGPVGVDIGAMLWPILCVACGSLGGVAVSMPLWQVVSICCCAIALNVALLACALSKRWGALHVLTWVHVASYFALWALQFQMNLWVITRLLVGLHSCWILAVNCELQSVLSQQQLRYSPWLDRIRALWLGRTTASDRRMYDDSIARVLDDEAVLPESAAAAAAPPQRAASMPIPADRDAEADSAELPMPPLGARNSSELHMEPVDAVAHVHVLRSGSASVAIAGAPAEAERHAAASSRSDGQR